MWPSVFFSSTIEVKKKLYYSKRWTPHTIDRHTYHTYCIWSKWQKFAQTHSRTCLTIEFLQAQRASAAKLTINHIVLSQYLNKHTVVQVMLSAWKEDKLRSFAVWWFLFFFLYFSLSHLVLWHTKVNRRVWCSLHFRSLQEAYSLEWERAAECQQFEIEVDSSWFSVGFLLYLVRFDLNKKSNDAPAKSKVHLNSSYDFFFFCSPWPRVFWNVFVFIDSWYPEPEV